MNLQKAIDVFGGRYTSANSVLVKCPAHPDRTPSLSLRNSDKELWNCFAGCEQWEVYRALRDNDILDRPSNVIPIEESPPEPKIKCTPEAYYRHTGLNSAQAQKSGKFTKEGLAHRYYHWDEMKEFPDYTRAWEDISYFHKTRQHITGQPKYIWEKDTPSPAPTIFGLQYIKHFAENDYHLNIVEGESDTLTCWAHELAAIGISGANNVRSELKAVIGMFKSVFIFHEPDQGGRQFVDNIISLDLKELEDTEVAVVPLPESVKDLNKLYQLDPNDFLEHYRNMIGGTSWKI